MTQRKSARLVRSFSIGALPCAILAHAAVARADFYVAPGGADNNDGSQAHPFHSIQKCANVATAGATCRIATGNYTEMVRPAASGQNGQPITFAPADASAQVVVIGTRAITNWTNHNGSIWKANAGGAFESLYVGGERMVVARWPNGTDPYRPKMFKATADGGGTWLIDTANLTQGNGHWVGAKIFLVPGLAWAADQRTVTGFNGGRVDFDSPISFSGFYTTDRFSTYYLYDKLELLDSAGEWFLDRGANTAYVWLPNGADPNTQSVTVSGVSAGFDLSNRSNVVIDGITIIYGDVRMQNANHCSLKNMRHLYPAAELSVGGADNEINGSEVAYAIGRCVNLGGTRNAVKGSLVHHCNYLGGYDEIIKISGPGSVVADSKLYVAGRDGVGCERSAGAINGSIVEHNEISDTGLIAKDTGGWYSFGTDGGGTQIRYNVVHDIFPADTEQNGYAAGFGIYLDERSSSFDVHHNVVWRSSLVGIFQNINGSNNHIYNNTVVGAGMSYSTGIGVHVSTNTVVANNLVTHLTGGSWLMDGNSPLPQYHHNGYYRAQGTQTNKAGLEQTAVTGDPRFTNAAMNDFTLMAGSPYIDKGAVIAGVTDGFVGATPDIGAYEVGGTERPGPRLIPGPPDAGAPGTDGGTTPTKDGGRPGSDGGPGTGCSAGCPGNGSGDAGGSSSGNPPGAEPGGGCGGENGCGGEEGCAMARGPAAGRTSAVLLAMLGLGAVARRRKDRRSAGR